MALLATNTVQGVSQGQAVARNPIIDVRVFPEDGQLNIFTSSKDELDLWQVPMASPGAKWRLTKVWHDFVYLWFGLGNGHGDYLAVVTKQSTAVYRLGSWGKPVLAKATEPGTRLKRVRNLAPQPERTHDFGLALQTGPDSSVSGQDTWTLMFSEDGRRWDPLQMTPQMASIADFVRLGPDDFALKGRLAQVDSGVTPSWHLYHFSGAGRWESSEVPGPSGPITDLKSYDYPNGLAIRRADGAVPQAWQWYLRDGTRWEDAHGLLPESQTHIEDMTGLGMGHVLGVLGGSETQTRGESLQWRYYYRTSDTWLPLLRLLTASGGLFAIAPFADDHGLAFQTLDEGTGAHAAQWSVSYASADNKWLPIQQLGEVCTAGIWSVKAYGGTRGIGVQCGNGRSHPLEWHWFARQDNDWTPLQKLIDPLSGQIWSVVSDDLAMGVAVQGDENGAAANESFSWSWFLPQQSGAWTEVANSVSLPPGFPDRSNAYSVSLPEANDANGRKGVLGVWDKNGSSRWYLRAKGAWLSIADATQ